MPTVAILPVKTFTEAKRRLRTGLSPGARRALAEAMFCDVLIALRRSELVHSVIVVSADHGAQQIAGGYGADIVDDREQGHNVAAVHGIEHALGAGADRVALVPVATERAPMRSCSPLPAPWRPRSVPAAASAT
jgi:2-phospho-L-lactate/phosphoenolpyruvate guanylyltransferase